MYISISLYIDIDTAIAIDRFICLYHTDIHTCEHTYIYICIFIKDFLYIIIYTYVYVYTYLYIWIHTHTHRYIDTYMMHRFIYETLNIDIYAPLEFIIDIYI
jgi:hypothetical protein